ncbi:CASP-like protein 4A1 isoform X2 [Hevea brasiliensis]|uniref:CASP-like protein 4A1 isoform X2 n=1 Tax=Hevea brasiliensis TaxID=3981 RepID=UPI0025EB27F6|nr:CASP-like protein 4A1 isoform X2 [Hevea brasiliensis]
MKNQENDQQHHHQLEENDHNQRLPEEEEEEEQNQSILIPTPINMHYSSSSPPPKPAPKPPSSRLDSPSDSRRSLDHSSQSHGYVFSLPQLKQSKYQYPPADQISHSYVFSSSPDVKLARSLSPPTPAAAAAAAAVPVSKVVSETQEDEVVKSVEDGIARGGGKRGANFSTKEKIMKGRALLGFRLLGLVFCLTSFSIMAADTNQGWALDSFHRYKEFRYCMSVNVMGFVYLGLQACDLAYSLATGKLVAHNQLRYYLDFSLDQWLQVQ